MVIRTERQTSAETPGPIGPKTAIWLPDRIVTNDDLVKYLDENNIRSDSGRVFDLECIVHRTGIESRHWLQELGEPPCIRSSVVPQMANKVASAVLEQTGWRHVDYLLASHSFPYGEALGKKVEEKLENTGKAAVTHTYPDTYAECASSIWIFDYMRSNPQIFEGKRVLYVASEYLSPIVGDINMSLLSDGAAAMAFVLGKDFEVLGSAARHYPDLAHLIRCPIKEEYVPEDGYLYFFPVEQPRAGKNNGERGLNFDSGEIEGQGVFRWALDRSTLAALAEESLEMANTDPAEIAQVIPHQANGRIIEALRPRMDEIGIDAKLVFNNIAPHGNTGSVSIPLAIHEAAEQRKIKMGDKVLLLGFGAGMTAAAAVVRV